MRRVAIAVLTAVIFLTSATPARACDPYWDWSCAWHDPYWDLLSSWPEPDPVRYVAPSWSDPVAWIAPTADLLDAWVPPEPVEGPVAVASDPIASAASLGLHAVTETWTGHVVSYDGAVTTYSSTSATVNAGTSARLVASVGTGETTVYDAAVLGGRTTLSNGQVVAGHIYENYVWNGTAWVVSAYVFFQDDSEIARATTGTAVAATPAPPTASVIPAPTPALVAIHAPMPDPSVYTVPIVGDTASAIAEPDPSPTHISIPQETAPTMVVAPAPRPAPTAYTVPLEGDIAPAVPDPSSPATQIPMTLAGARVVRVGIALGAQADPLGRAEVLRGRRVSLWPRATVDGVPATVLHWHLLSGELTALGATSGQGDEPLVAMWSAVTRAGIAYPTSIRVAVDVPGEDPREIEASIDVVVLAPAIVE